MGASCSRVAAASIDPEEINPSAITCERTNLMLRGTCTLEGSRHVRIVCRRSMAFKYSSTSSQEKTQTDVNNAQSSMSIVYETNTRSVVVSGAEVWSVQTPLNDGHFEVELPVVDPGKLKGHKIID